MNFDEVKLGHIASIYSGYAFKSSILSKDGGIPILKIANIQNRCVSKDCPTYLPEDFPTEHLEKYIYKRDDILVAMTGAGSVGKVGKIRYLDDLYLVNQRVGMIRVDTSKAVPEYVYQVLATKEYEKTIYHLGLGAGQPNVSPTDIGNLIIPFPSFNIQLKIALILSAYDDLIENNIRRINILEEIAQRLYREWFVHFRFLGHENVKMVESELGMIPEEWEVKTFGNLFEIKYGKGLPTKKLLNTDVYPVYGAGGIIGYYNELVINEKVTLITCRGNGSGKVWRTKEPAFVTNNSFLILPKQNYEHLKYHFVEQLCLNSNVKSALSGSAQPQITIKGLSFVNALLPPKAVIDKYYDFVDEIPELIDKLHKQNETLCQIRDLLLPKLISGKIDVSELDVDTGAAVA